MIEELTIKPQFQQAILKGNFSDSGWQYDQSDITYDQLGLQYDQTGGSQSDVVPIFSNISSITNKPVMGFSKEITP